MPNFDTPNSPNEVEASAPNNAEAFARSKQDKLDAITEIDNPALQKLAKAELQELEALETQMNWDQFAIQDARNEFKADMDGLFLVYDKFADMDGFEVFVNLLTSSSLSKIELERLYEFVTSQWSRFYRKVRKVWLPTNRESYQLFANKFGIPISSSVQEKQSTLDSKNKDLFLNSLPTLHSIPDLPQVAELTKMIMALKNLEGADAQNQMLAISTYLVWPDGESGELDSILTALKKQDAENADSGNPTQHFETFTRTVRDFSPDVSRRIDVFVVSYSAETKHDELAISPYQKWIIQGAIPEGSKLETHDNWIFTATTPEGDTVQITKDGNTLNRSYSLNGSEFALETPLLHSDFTQAQREYEKIHQTHSPKLQKTENALSFLENPAFADVPLADMQDGLRKTLGYSQYEALNIGNITDKAELISLLKNNVNEFRNEIAHAERVYGKAIQEAVAVNRRHNAEADEKIKTTLKALKNSGLEFLDIEFLITNIKAGYITPDIGVPFDRQNLDLASGNFWEPLSETKNPTKHIEYIYRIANKVLTWNPEGTVDGKLIGFSLDQVIANPDVAQKTDGEVKYLLKHSGAWSETMGVNKEKVGEKLKVKASSHNPLQSHY